MILVTGGAGYLGCVLVRELLNKGEAVRVFDKLFFGDEGLDEVRDKIDLIQGDLRYFDEAILDGIDSVIHLAGLSNDPTAEYNPKANHEMNTVATETLAKTCKRRGVKRFVFASTCSIYDKGLYAEDFLLDETSEVAPRAAYAVSNYEAERILLAMADETFCPVIVRKGTLYGFSPRMRYDLVVNTFVKDALMNGALKVFCGGEMWRPLVDVTDAAKAYICCVEAPEHKVRGQVFNLVYKNYRILELAHWVREAFKPIRTLEIEVDYSHYRARSYRVSGQKIETVLGFKPTVAVKESVERLVEMIQRHGYTDFLNPKYYNIQWLTLLCEMEA
ncbi:MAG TPA: SDR family oxidoreductase, partial [Candidatus Methylomirabilis sp.]|nr:SDR family oxidoreductase [Candidatus Methylomirabilis sp.]